MNREQRCDPTYGSRVRRDSSPFARYVIVVLLTGLVFAALPWPVAHAASYTVNTLDDNEDDDDSCTLREAILAANNAPTNDDCGEGSPDDDIITFIVNGTITLSEMLPSIADAATVGKLTIAGDSNITISGDNNVQVLYVNSGADLTLQNLTIANGASDRGGGLFNNEGGTVTIINSTFSNNIAYESGGLFSDYFSTMTITNSTFSNNTASLNGSGLFNHLGMVTIKNTIVANSSSGGNCSGSISANSRNNMATDATCGASFTQVTPAQLNLGPLVDNGGLTQTHALLPGSPAIDAIPLADCTDAEGNPITTDQRGVARPQGVGCDIGAFERDGFALTAIKNGTGSGTVTSNPAGINCGADCSEIYPSNTVVTLTATPSLGSAFNGWSGDPDCSDGRVTMNVNKTCTATFNSAPLCQGVTATSLPQRVTFRRANQQAAIYVTIRNNSGVARTVTAITPQASEPFTIGRISPSLPMTINNRSSRIFTVTVRGPAVGPFPVVATRPYFDTALDCGVLTTATEPRLLVPLRVESIQAELHGDHVLVEAHGEGIASVQLQLFDLNGKQLLNQASNTTMLTLPIMDSSGQLLANGVYLYVVRVRGYDGQEYASEIRKLVILR